MKEKTQEITEINEEMSSLKRSEKNKKKEKSFLVEVIEIIVIAAVLAFALRTFVIESFWVPSGSMLPTIQLNDRVWVTKFSYKIGEPERGDVVVFRPPAEAHAAANEKYFIKRLIGLPGETVEFKDNRLYIDGELVEEDYLGDDVYTDNLGPFKVGEDCYFFCGDNRTGSYDSRAWGDVERDNLVGQAQCIYWPLARIGGL